MLIKGGSQTHFTRTRYMVNIDCGSCCTTARNMPSHTSGARTKVWVDRLLAASAVDPWPVSPRSRVKQTQPTPRRSGCPSPSLAWLSVATLSKWNRDATGEFLPQRLYDTIRIPTYIRGIANSVAYTDHCPRVRSGNQMTNKCLPGRSRAYAT